jgi:hypothetical protein
VARVLHGGISFNSEKRKKISGDQHRGKGAARGNLVLEEGDFGARDQRGGSGDVRFADFAWSKKKNILESQRPT